MEITLTSSWTSEQLAWHYNEIFWSQAKRNLQEFADNHNLDEMIELFDIIIEYSNAEVLSETEMNDIIWFEWEDIMRIYNA